MSSISLSLREKIVGEYTKAAGSHDDPKLYGGPAGDPGLCGPESISWKLHSDVGAVTLAGTAAIVMEILHPSVMSGVQDLSSYREDPFRRARTTTGYVLGTTFGNTEEATELIGRVKRMHSRINGRRPDGVEYQALDPHLIGWVHTCIPWGILKAYERYTGPLTPVERDRYLAEQAVIGRMGGAGDDIPETAAELDAYIEALRPELSVNAQTLEFFDFLLDNPFAPPLPDPLRRRYMRMDVKSGLSLMPQWARRMVGFDHSPLERRLVLDPHMRSTGALLRWAFGPTPPWRALAEERVTAAPTGPTARTGRPRRTRAPASASR